MIRILLLILTFSFSIASGANQYSLPTQISNTIEEQANEYKALVQKKQSEYSQEDWTKFAMLAVIRTSNADGSINKSSFDEANKAINAAYKKFPNDAEILSIKGSWSCIKAGDPDLGGVEALALANNGFRVLDKAILMDRHDLGARLQRAISFHSAPLFLGKQNRALSDFKFLLKKIPSTQTNIELRSMIMVMLSEIYLSQKSDQLAHTLLREVIDLKVEHWSGKADAMLKKIS